ncbi:MAG: Phosphoglycerate kinase [Candidatus Magnetoglobus multicellularis str. Araruama]|uniref:Phosphoglycerate kinase n=1 Tax=Candidatus Magnetoglobus multicellularis str. Araruama TaxID=890399 RepID=A0A1V1PB64_9BACT|nr:MAG: Phosphoglycerate kinase [Candidatus Magnetoglobus multicellularis str. Araruama]
MINIQDIQLSNKRVLIRVDFNVPMDENKTITDDSRIKGALETISYALENNARVILASHLGRPKGAPDNKFSLEPVAHQLSKLLGKSVQLAADCVGSDVQAAVDKMVSGDILLLENLRFHKGEKQNDTGFAKSLASLCDIYINDAFAVSHRSHASVDAINSHVSQRAAGFLLQKELNYFQKAMNNPARPLTAVIGGAKVSSKLAALENMINHVDKIIIGGAMANTFLKSLDCNVGKSLVEDDCLWAAHSLLKQSVLKNIHVYLPIDAIVASEIKPDAMTCSVPVKEIPRGQMIGDIGPATCLLYAEALQNSQTIIWNGPMGVFEMEAFKNGTQSMIHCVANSPALTIVGGGDTDAALHQAGKADQIDYISTGGGAFLTLMEGKALPAVAALNH